MLIWRGKIEGRRSGYVEVVDEPEDGGPRTDDDRANRRQQKNNIDQPAVMRNRRSLRIACHASAPARSSRRVVRASTINWRSVNLRQNPMTRQHMTRWKSAGSKKAIMLEGTEPMKAITMEKSGIDTAYTPSRTAMREASL